MTPSHVLVLQNLSTVVSDDEVRHQWVPALQHQISYHFKPFWNVGAIVGFASKANLPAASTWVIAILDDSDQAGTLGYHGVTGAGLPDGKVFAGTDLHDGYSPTVTASHEALELIADPYVNLAWQTSNSEAYAVEVGDPVEADSLGYDVPVRLADGTTRNVLVSDFITPEWFEQGLVGGAAVYDYARHLTAPLGVAPGGYVSILTAKASQFVWTQKTMRGGELVEVPADANPFRDPDAVRFRPRG